MRERRIEGYGGERKLREGRGRMGDRVNEEGGRKEGIKEWKNGWGSEQTNE